MTYYKSKFHNIVLKSNTSFKLLKIYHNLFTIMLTIKYFPFINHAIECFLFEKMVIEILLNIKFYVFFCSNKFPFIKINFK